MQTVTLFRAVSGLILLLNGCANLAFAEPLVAPISIPKIIVTSDQPGPEEKLAARKLAETLHEITGVGHGVVKESELPPSALSAI